MELSSGLVHLKISAFPRFGGVMELRTVKTRVMKLDVSTTLNTNKASCNMAPMNV